MLLLSMIHDLFRCRLHVNLVRVIVHFIISNAYVAYAYWCFYYVNICIIVLHLYLICYSLTLLFIWILKNNKKTNPI